PVELAAVVEAAVASARPAAETKGVRLRIADCGLRIADCGLRIEESDAETVQWDDLARQEAIIGHPQSATPSPQSPIHNPQSAFTVLGDADRLQQVVWNLVSNAIKFTPEGGSIVVRLAQRAQGDGYYSKTRFPGPPGRYRSRFCTHALFQHCCTSI